MEVNATCLSMYVNRSMCVGYGDESEIVRMLDAAAPEWRACVDDSQLPDTDTSFLTFTPQQSPIPTPIPTVCVDPFKRDIAVSELYLDFMYDYVYAFRPSGLLLGSASLYDVEYKSMFFTDCIDHDVNNVQYFYITQEGSTAAYLALLWGEYTLPYLIDPALMKGDACDTMGLSIVNPTDVSVVDNYNIKFTIDPCVLAFKSSFYFDFIRDCVDGECEWKFDGCDYIVPECALVDCDMDGLLNHLSQNTSDMMYVRCVVVDAYDEYSPVMQFEHENVVGRMVFRSEYSSDWYIDRVYNFKVHSAGVDVYFDSIDDGGCEIYGDATTPSPTPTPIIDEAECYNVTGADDASGGTYATFVSYMLSGPVMELYITNEYKGHAHTLVEYVWGENCDMSGLVCSGYYANDTYIDERFYVDSGILPKCGKELVFDVMINLSASIVRYRDTADDTYTWYTMPMSMIKKASDWYAPLDVHVCFTVSPAAYSAWSTDTECNEWAGGTFKFKVSELNYSETTAFNAASRFVGYASWDGSVDIVDGTPYAALKYTHYEDRYSDITYLNCKLTSFDGYSVWRFGCTYNCTTECNPVSNGASEAELWPTVDACKKELCKPLYDIDNYVLEGNIEEGNPRNWMVGRTAFNMWTGRRVIYENQYYYEYSIYDHEGFDGLYYKRYM